MTVTHDDYAMAVRTTVTEGASVVIADQHRSTSGAAPLTHWSYRQADAHTVTVTVDGQTTTHTITAQPAPDLSLPIGVHAFAVTPAEPYTAHRDLAAELNALPAVDVVRLGIPWKALQPSSAAFDATEATYWDGVLADIDARGAKVSLTVGTTPTWAGPSATAAPTDPDDFGQWVDDIIDRWSSTVEILSIDPWNEPNADPYTGTVASYLGILRAAHTAAAGRVPIALGSIAFVDVPWLEELFALGMTGDDFDVVDFHPYPISFAGATHWVNPHRPPAAADIECSVIGGCHLLEATLADHGITGRDLFISEYGLPSNPRDDASPHLRMTDHRAVDWLGVAFDHARRIPSLKAFCIHEARDRVEGASWINGWGMLRIDGTRSPKYAVLADALA